MKRNFKCLNKECNKKFSAEDDGNVKCPYCGSDNVTPSNRNYTTGYIIAILVATIFAYVLYYISKPKICTKCNLPKDKCICGTDTIIPRIEEDSLEINIVSNAEYNKNTNKYSIKVCTSINGIFNYYVREEYSDKDLWTSNNGEFNNIDPNKSGRYVFYARNEELNLSCQRIIPDFKEVPKQSITKEDLEKLMKEGNVQKWKTDNRILSNVSFSVVNLHDGDTNPESLTDIKNKVRFYGWKNFSVQEYTLDSEKRIKQIKIYVEYL